MLLQIRGSSYCSWRVTRSNALKKSEHALFNWTALKRFSCHAGCFDRNVQLEYLVDYGSSVNSPSKKTLYQNGSCWTRLEERFFSTRWYLNQSLHRYVRFYAMSFCLGSSNISYIVRSAKRKPSTHQLHRREAARDQRFRLDVSSGWCISSYGPKLLRLCLALCSLSNALIFPQIGQSHHARAANCLHTGGKNNQLHLRTVGILKTFLWCAITSKDLVYSICGHRDRQDTDLFDKDFFLTSSGTNNCSPLQNLMESRNALQIEYRSPEILIFLCNSENDVKAQIWSAVPTYVLIVIVIKELQI